jgi:hypothetical protein
LKIKVTGDQCDRRSMWQEIKVTGDQSDRRSKWQEINVTGDQCDRRSVTGDQSDRRSKWQEINVTGDQSDRRSMWHILFNGYPSCVMLLEISNDWKFIWYFQFYGNLIFVMLENPIDRTPILFNDYLIFLLVVRECKL